MQIGRASDVAVLDRPMATIIFIVCPECDGKVEYVWYGRGYEIDQPDFGELWDIVHLYEGTPIKVILRFCLKHRKVS